VYAPPGTMRRNDMTSNNAGVPSCQPVGPVGVSQSALMLHDDVARSVRVFRYDRCIRRLHRWQHNVAPSARHLNAGGAAFNQRGVDQAWKAVGQGFCSLWYNACRLRIVSRIHRSALPARNPSLCSR
jgi:hypothetical protein